MAFSVRAISNLKEFPKVADSWDTLVSKYGDNPFTLSDFIRIYAESNDSQGWRPLFLAFCAHDDIVGIAPLMIRQKFGMRMASFILKPYCTPDFVIADQFRSECIGHILDFLFQTLHCKLADLTFPAEAKNLNALEESCKLKRIYFDTEPYLGRRILSVEGNWEQFEALRGSNFRRRFRRMERRLNEAGSSRILCMEGESSEADAFGKIMEVEKASWKEAWRSQRKEETDPDLWITWKGATSLIKTCPEFSRATWFLELNDRPIAYALVVQYKQTAIIVKTSYDARYRSYYPGMYIINAAVRALFDGKSVSNIDFLTDMRFMEAWTPLVRDRVRVFLGKGVLPTKIASFYKDVQVRKILSKLSNQLPRKAVRLFEWQ